MRRSQRAPLAPSRRDGFLEEVAERLSGLPDLELRPMFGGHGVYAEGTMFGIVHGSRLYLKVDDQSREDFLRHGMAPFRPARGPVIASYYEVPADVQEQERELLSWARRALRAAETSPQRKSPKRASPEQILEPHAAAVRKLARALCKLVREAAPHAEEAGYPGWKLIGYRAPHYFCFVAPQLDHVRLGFEHGARLRDAGGLLEGHGSQVRYVSVYPGRPLPRSELLELVKAALDVPPRPRKGR